MSLDALLLFGRAMFDPDLNTALPHLKGGDCYPPRSFSLFNKWWQAMRMWKLTPTYGAGSALDEFPFVPDLFVSSTVFEDFLLGGLGIKGMRGEHFFSATVFPHFTISGPFPAELQIPCEIAAASGLLGLIPLPRTSPTVDPTANVRDPFFVGDFLRVCLTTSSRRSVLLE